MRHTVKCRRKRGTDVAAHAMAKTVDFICTRNINQFIFLSKSCQCSLSENQNKDKFA
jgi:hypothetical protein